MKTPFYIPLLSCAALLVGGSWAGNPATEPSAFYVNLHSPVIVEKLDADKGNRVKTGDLKPLRGYRLSVSDIFN